ncbi:23S rRNA (uracil(1939)-C(5))-methyltransferase RlmD [Marinomonas sp. 2405UD68-3]|uniref:23S rRNA (uracil(1939)-C(5))-methyltransferase RlmD n=1 Tax=Marinomonas sp. 2405UD68-3 TaxID=3391835 RepID=UPI0039C9F762
MKRKQNRRSTAKMDLSSPIEEYVIGGLTHDAKGVARVNGKVVFIEGALPTEVVSAQIVKSGRRFDEAKLVSVLTVSDDRVTPECSHFGQCGGCSFQHLSYQQQVVAKHSWLSNQLRRIYTQDDISILSGNEFGYRRRARLSVKAKGSSIELGFRKSSSSAIVDIKQCPVLTNSLECLIAPLNQFVKSCSDASKIGHIELLEDDLGVSVVVRLTGAIHLMAKEGLQELAEHHKFSLFWQESNEDRLTLHPLCLRQYQVSDTVINFHPQDFIQVNAAMNQKMVDQAVSWIDLSGKDIVLDLFCGAGNFSFVFAKIAERVIGVELLPSMVENAQRNQRLNELDNVNFIAADLTKMESAALITADITKIFLDPPRSGAMEFLPNIIKLAPEKILYVSCSVSTLVRDAEFLVANGYQVEKVSLMEMFPQTAHVETMMLLQKSKKNKR